MTIETETTNIAKLRETVDKLLTIIPIEEPLLRGHLEAVRDDAEVQGNNSAYWWKRALQLFGNRVLEIKETVQPELHPAWIKEARTVIEQARAV